MIYQHLIIFAFVLSIHGLTILPFPKNISSGDKTLQINDICQTQILLNSNDEEQKNLIGITEIYFDLHFQQSNCNFKKSLSNKNTKSENLKILAEVTDMKIKLAQNTKDEAYKLSITTKGEILIKSQTYVGYIRFFRALDTLLQIITKNGQKQLIMNQLPIVIEDEPDFWYRGVMIDTSRHYLSVNTILKTIDSLMMNKMNILHWHIVDDESFPLYLKSSPEITQKGSYSEKEQYSIKDVQNIITYAKQRGVGIIPEIDTPGHTLAWGNSEKYNKAIVKCGTKNGQLDPTLDLTYELIETVMKDIQELFKDSLFVHFGGDEVETECWDQRPEIKEFMKQKGIPDYVALETYYRKQQKKIWQPNCSIHILRKEIIQSHQKIAYWTNEEINLDVESDDIIHWWGTTDQLDSIKEKTNQIILSNYDLLYFDIGFGSPEGDKYGDFVTWKDIHLKFDPYPIIKGQVIGAIGCLWGELNNDSTHFNKLFIRTSVLASKLWNIKFEKEAPLSEYVKSLSSMEHRLRNKGIKSSPVTSDYCSLNTEQCFPLK